MEIVQRVDKLEGRVSRLEEEHQKHEIEFVETKVYVKEIYKKLDSVSNTLDSLKISNTSKWEQFWSKAAWFLIGAVFSLVLYLMKNGG